MSTAREAKKAELKKRLIDAAEAEIIEHGLAGLKARAVTARAGCALGSLYTVVEDLDMLVIEVNSRTLTELGATLTDAVSKAGDTPQHALQALALRYADFAIAHQPLWLSLFEHRLPEGQDIPEWHKQEHAVLVEVIAPHLAKLRPDMTREALILRTRTTFAAVHGVVYLALQGRFVGVPMEALKSEIAGLVETLTAGAAQMTKD
ncbi:MAG: TetR/AcrR family transcriptional regulator [Rhodobacteraceae bacterium]|uniref:TetR/AcrR family transcriptional regulator n=1 Tax=Celeribacter sp. HF31 TaxID=2721558 RepID=UPI00142FB778|nr:TetR/AcrR family transcriptional regulator [Celeribacter sp. HF31]NIY79268.1 TetR/AcrR family transcriptional regulator [Celeribacter sp. HF31]NVK45790.1 TetR/AcrR family transcriptional regulator [Paracoccaceae bacterium]